MSEVCTKGQRSIQRRQNGQSEEIVTFIKSHDSSYTKLVVNGLRPIFLGLMKILTLRSFMLMKCLTLPFVNSVCLKKKTKRPSMQLTRVNKA